MSVWLALPSKRPVEQAEPIFALWRERGYKIALVTDDQISRNVDLQCISVEYQGYARSVNYLAERILSPRWAGQPGNDPDCQWIVTGGDDTEPDQAHTADEIAAQCSEHFRTVALSPENYDWCEALWPNGCQPDQLATFGVMQPTGDPFAGNSISRICGSPWMGREFCQRINGGQGPFWPEYTHMFGDEEMQNVTLMLGILWQRPDLTHYHHHFMRQGDAAVRTEVPDFLREANSQAHWEKYKGLFTERQMAGFPGHETISAATMVGV